MLQFGVGSTEQTNLHNLLLSLLINFSGRHRLFHLTKNHV